MRASPPAAPQPTDSRVSLDRVRRVGQLEIVNVLKVSEAGADNGTQPVELRFLRGDPRHEVVHTSFLSQTEYSWPNRRIERASGVRLRRSHARQCFLA
jgi:hypothetical protein